MTESNVKVSLEKDGETYFINFEMNTLRLEVSERDIRTTNITVESKQLILNQVELAIDSYFNSFFVKELEKEGGLN